MVFWPPDRPAIRVPRKTREGVAAPPIEPGARCTRWVPWLPPRPLNPWRFITPEVPLPLLTEVTSTSSPCDSRSTPISCPTSYSLTSSRRSSTSLTPGSTPARSNWPAMGLVSLEAFFCPKVTWSALYPSRSCVLTWTTRHGRTRRTVTGTTRLSSSQTCVMPTFSPTIALVAMGCASFCGLSHERSARESPGGARLSVVPHGSRRRGPARTSVGTGHALREPSVGPAQGRTKYSHVPPLGPTWANGSWPNGAGRRRGSR